MAKTVDLTLTNTFPVKQNNFAITRDDGTVVFVKMFSAPYGNFWVGDDNLPIRLDPDEQDAIFNMLRKLQAINKVHKDNERARYANQGS